MIPEQVCEEAFERLAFERQDGGVADERRRHRIEPREVFVEMGRGRGGDRLRLLAQLLCPFAAGAQRRERGRSDVRGDDEHNGRDDLPANRQPMEGEQQCRRF